ICPIVKIDRTITQIDRLAAHGFRRRLEDFLNLVDHVFYITVAANHRLISGMYIKATFNHAPELAPVTQVPGAPNACRSNVRPASLKFFVVCAESRISPLCQYRVCSESSGA